MNAPVSIEVAPVVASPNWRRLLLPLSAGLLLLGILFNHEIVAAVDTWNASTAYNHCFLIIPIALCLLWDRRFDLVGVPVRLMPLALLLGVPLAAVWLAAERLGIMEGRQLVAVSFIEVLVLALFGPRMAWAVAGPLLYLYFLVPFGEFLTPRLQDVTTFFIRYGLQVLGVPAYIDGYVIEIPQGTFFVAEACAGLRFLIASVAFGCLYALMMYRSPLRRATFILVSIVVPVIANGFRGTGIVYLGYLLGSAQAATADHIIYGWVFFSAVILLLIALGLPFREDHISTRSAIACGQEKAARVSVGGAFALVLVLAAIAAVSPTVAAGISMAATPVITPPRIEFAADCTVQASASTLTVRTQRVICGAQAMDIKWQAFSPRSTAGTVMAERRRMIADVLSEGLSEQWLEASDRSPSSWRIMKSNEPAYTIAVSVWVEGKPVRPGLAMRLRMALNSLSGSAFAPMVVTVTPVVDWQTHDAVVLQSAVASLPAFLLAHQELDQAIEAMSRMH